MQTKVDVKTLPKQKTLVNKFKTFEKPQSRKISWTYKNKIKI